MGNPPKKQLKSPIVSEFAGAELGDVRLNRRLEKVVDLLASKPDAGFPLAMTSEADLEGFYRFLANSEATFEALHQPHVRATCARAASQSVVLVVHDTTEFRFSSNREGLARLTKSGHGFLGQFSLVVTTDDRHHALGVVAVEAWARSAQTPSALRAARKITYSEARVLPSEQDRWLRGVNAAEAALGGMAAVVHVMDSEADDYGLMCDLVASGRRWIIRQCYDRRLADVPEQKTKELLATRDVVSRREVQLAPRRRQPGGERQKRVPARDRRQASLAIRATAVTFQRPSYCEDKPATLSINVVAVTEEHPPEGETPVEWLLTTTEPVETEQQILKIVDAYRGRWVVEEYFKALKSGCAFEKRQLESIATLKKALALFIPIAWALLHLRTLSRSDSGAPGLTVVTETQLEVLRRAAEKPLPADPTVQDVLLAIARLGGHLKRNGTPGWQVLGRGFHELLMLVAGFQLARKKM